MRNNHQKKGSVGDDQRIYLDDDWYSGGLPANVQLASGVYVDTSYGFTQFFSAQPHALTIQEGSGCYDRCSMIVSEEGRIEVGRYCILNGSTLLCKQQISIADHCMLAWGSVITDNWFDASLLSTTQRNLLLQAVAADSQRRHPFFGDAQPVVLEENCWVGFDAVILPGVRLGRGCVVGCKTVITEDVPPYAVVTGSPARVVRYLTPNDTEEEKQKALQIHVR